MMKEMKLTNQEVLNLDAALTAAGTYKEKSKFSLKVAYNRQILRPFVKAIEEAQEPGPEMKEFQEKRDAIIARIGTTTSHPNGQTTVSVPPDKQEAFKAELEPLRKKYKKAIDEYESQLKSVRDETIPGLANSGEPIKLHMLPKDLPKGMDGNLLFGLIDLLPEMPDE